MQLIDMRISERKHARGRWKPLNTKMDIVNFGSPGTFKSSNY